MNQTTLTTECGRLNSGECPLCQASPTQECPMSDSIKMTHGPGELLSIIRELVAVFGPFCPDDYKDGQAALRSANAALKESKHGQ